MEIEMQKLIVEGDRLPKLLSFAGGEASIALCETREEFER
jgi:hypothetical protein